MTMLQDMDVDNDLGDVAKSEKADSLKRSAPIMFTGTSTFSSLNSKSVSKAAVNSHKHLGANESSIASKVEEYRFE